MDECKPLLVGRAGGSRLPGKAVQLDPIKLALKAPGTKRLRLIHNWTALKVCFQFKLAPLQLGARGGAGAVLRGRAVQVDPMKPKLKPPGTKRLKLEYDGLLSNIGFKFSLRRYNEQWKHDPLIMNKWLGLQAGAYSRPLFGST